MTTDTLEVRKVQHAIKTRLLTVKRITELSPSMRRITLTGGLDDFISASFDDHVKLMVPEIAGTPLHVPTIGSNGLVFEEGKPKPAMRDYTPRRYDPVSNELDIDFVLHHDGPATQWAMHAQPGDQLGIAGPRGSFVIPVAFDWHLLIGDETAIPAIGRRLEELPSSAIAIVIIKAAREDARIELSSQCRLEIHWIIEPSSAGHGAELLASIVRNIELPAGEGYVWAAGEHHDIQEIRRYLVDECGIDKNRIRASSYWRKSLPATHERFADV